MHEKYDRQIRLLNILMRGRKWTVRQLSYELGVCTHTVKRDIADLQFHFPIDTFTGRYGGIKINPCFSLGNRFITMRELEVIKRALVLLSVSSEECACEAGELLKKLR